MTVDRKFEVVRPTLDRLIRMPLEVNPNSLLNPNSTSPVAIVDGELVQMSAGKWVRAVNATAPSFFNIEDRGDYGVQASRKLSAIVGGGGYWANTVIFDSGLTSEGVAVKWGSVTVESVARAGLVAQGGTGYVIGYVVRTAAANGGKLQVFVTSC